MRLPEIKLSINKSVIKTVHDFVERHFIALTGLVLSIISIVNFHFYYLNRLGLAYNDARSHLDIARRVVEGLKTGMAQLGSVWLPLPHLLMIPTIWNDFMWHSGLAGALPSMISFVITGIVIIRYLRLFGVGLLGQLLGVIIFAANINILYMQSTAMTELLLIATMTIGVYDLTKWHLTDEIYDLIKAAFWIMLSTLIRYDGWFLFAFAVLLVIWHSFRKKGFKAAEGSFFFFCTLAGVGIILWFLWNLLIFGDPLYFALGPYSAHTQQAQLESAGVLATKHDIFLSTKIYFYALAYNSYAFNLLIGLIGSILMWFDSKVKTELKLASTSLFAPLVFNIVALYFGFSVLFVQGISGNSWFNVRYGLMMLPSIAIFAGYLVNRAKNFRWIILGFTIFVIYFAFANFDVVTLDDARVGSSGKNVKEVSGWLQDHAANKKGFVLIAVASHDAIIFSSGLPMSRFIHEGTGPYWDSATISPDKWARWIIMRTYDDSDLTWKMIKNRPGLKMYKLVHAFPFADIYELKPEYVKNLITEPIFQHQKKKI